MSNYYKVLVRHLRTRLLISLWEGHQEGHQTDLCTRWKPTPRVCTSCIPRMPITVVLVVASTEDSSGSDTAVSWAGSGNSLSPICLRLQVWQASKSAVVNLCVGFLSPFLPFVTRSKRHVQADDTAATACFSLGHLLQAVGLSDCVKKKGLKKKALLNWKSKKKALLDGKSPRGACLKCHGWYWRPFLDVVPFYP
jgi:hypothetical protein